MIKLMGGTPNTLYIKLLLLATQTVNTRSHNNSNITRKHILNILYQTTSLPNTSTSIPNSKHKILTNIGIAGSTQVMVELNGSLEADNLLVLILPRGLVIRKVAPLDQVLNGAVSQRPMVQDSVDLEPGGLDAILVVPEGVIVVKDLFVEWQRVISL